MKHVFLVAAIPLLVACAASPPPDVVSGEDPSEPSAPSRPIRYEPITAGTVFYKPVDPKPWTEQNQQVSPKPENE